MREGWEYKKLGDLCQITMGQSPNSNSINDVDGIEFHQGKTCFGERFLGVSSLFCNAPTKLAEANSVLLCVRAPVGYPNITERKICIGRGLCALNAKKEVENQYLFYALLKKQDYFEKNATGSTFKAISSKIVSNAEIPLPPKSTQIAIVSELDKINEIIDLKKTQLKDLDLLAQSIFYDMFGDPIENPKGWEVKKLADVCTKITDGTHDTPQRLTEGIKFITGKHIRPGYIDYMNSDYVKEQVHKEIYARCNPEFGDVLYTNIGANLANAAINTVHYEFSMKNVALLKLQKDIIHGMVLQFYLNNPRVREKILENYSNGGAQKFLSLKSIALIKTILPPLSLQQSFAEKIQAIESQKSAIKQSLAEVENLLASRMDYYFN